MINRKLLKGSVNRMVVHTVKSGDSIYSVSKEYGISPAEIIAVNRMRNPGRLAVGQTLVIRKPKITHVVVKGDTLAAIAEKHGTSVRRLLQNNPGLYGKTHIVPGQTLVISYDDEPEGEISTYGFVYPHIDERVLRVTLPYLTYMPVLFYGFTHDGSLISPSVRDDRVVRTALEYNVMPLLVLTSTGKDRMYSGTLADSVLDDTVAGDRLIENILRITEKRGYGGAIVDFEYISPRNAQAYGDWLGRCREAMNSVEKSCFVMAAPRQSEAQQDILVQGHNYAHLSSNSDGVLVMTNEMKGSYDEPGPGEPIGAMRNAMKYADEHMIGARLGMALQSYGFNWKLPYVKGKTVAVTFPNAEAQALATEKNAAIQYDLEAQAPFMQYYDKTHGAAVEHIVWFEDGRSIDSKLDLVSEFGLDGISLWNIMHFFPQLWAVLSSRFSIR